MLRAQLVLIASFAAACLPEDPRSPPGRLLVTAEPDSALESGFTTADGWEIAFDEFLIVLGHVRTVTCPQYSESTSQYARVLDLARPAAQTVATVYALGACSVGFLVGNPEGPPLVLGDGVSDADARELQEPGSDGFTQDARAVLRVAGSARTATAQLEFVWTFRQLLDYERCAELELRGDEVRTVALQLRGAELFRDARDGELRFAGHAAADGDGDGRVALEELAHVPAGSGTLASHLYLNLVPRLVSAAGSSGCEGRVLVAAANH